MKKNTIIKIVLVLIIVGGYLIFDSMRYTTYREVISDVLSEEDPIRYIKISSDLDLIGKKAEVRIEDEEMIKKILEDPSDMKLKKKILGNPPTLRNIFTIYTRTGTELIYFDRTSISVGSNYYVVEVDEMPYLNKLYLLINRENFEWEIE